MNSCWVRVTSWQQHCSMAQHSTAQHSTAQHHLNVLHCSLMSSLTVVLSPSQKLRAVLEHSKAQLVSSHGEECKTLFKEAAWHSICVNRLEKVPGWEPQNMGQHRAVCATFPPNRGSYNSGQSEAGSCSATQHITTSLQIQTSA